MRRTSKVGDIPDVKKKTSFPPFNFLRRTSKVGDIPDVKKKTSFLPLNFLRRTSKVFPVGEKVDNNPSVFKPTLFPHNSNTDEEETRFNLDFSQDMINHSSKSRQPTEEENRRDIELVRFLGQPSSTYLFNNDTLLMTISEFKLLDLSDITNIKLTSSDKKKYNRAEIDRTEIKRRFKLTLQKSTQIKSIDIDGIDYLIPLLIEYKTLTSIKKLILKPPNDDENVAINDEDIYNLLNKIKGMVNLEVLEFSKFKIDVANFFKCSGDNFDVFFIKMMNSLKQLQNIKFNDNNFTDDEKIDAYIKFLEKYRTSSCKDVLGKLELVVDWIKKNYTESQESEEYFYNKWFDYLLHSPINKETSKILKMGVWLENTHVHSNKRTQQNEEIIKEGIGKMEIFFQELDTEKISIIKQWLISLLKELDNEGFDPDDSKNIINDNFVERFNIVIKILNILNEKTLKLLETHIDKKFITKMNEYITKFHNTWSQPEITKRYNIIIKNYIEYRYEYREKSKGGRKAPKKPSKVALKAPKKPSNVALKAPKKPSKVALKASRIK